ncbi:hypothetical protein OC842_000478 [Tilletia horrida]|uniref:U1 small nuclear ribonucleoprotein 70 kDa n=1 Tax=Tilletia horrida TaxID=155126 RepID=A0AAN6GGV3_9BASI|nr:hypothetical protein OC842_000478 [Tilletia horrida]
MSHLLPPNLVRLFVPRPPVAHAPPLPQNRDPNAVPHPSSHPKRQRSAYRGVGAFLEERRQEAADRGEATKEEDTEEEKKNFSLAEVTKQELRREEKAKKRVEAKEQADKSYNPQEDANAVGDPFKTLFLSRLPYDLTEKDIKREFEQYGPIESLRLVRNHEGKSRGYAFVLYERERDMRAAYKEAEGIKMGGRRIMVDVERGRTVKDWKPMRLGGGLGGSSRKKKEPAAAAQPPPMMNTFRGGFRGGGGGGFRGGFGGGRGGGFGGRGGYGGGGGGFGGGGGGYGGGGGGGGGGYGGGGGGGGGFGGPGGGFGGGGGHGGGGGGGGHNDYGPPPAKRGRY